MTLKTNQNPRRQNKTIQRESPTQNKTQSTTKTVNEKSGEEALGTCDVCEDSKVSTKWTCADGLGRASVFIDVFYEKAHCDVIVAFPKS
ncbi:hypothetical protein BLNAU_14485 [Blattamonas nauphoetae]|uniref:Uncharacterized protein n=1 Tax=Blattamonas nauphoetae TaxID=2049346 RepID=A0ABQ9XDM8_9EUKA|nr:hypothetical protein BLNAU_14485 [Blattamonas nauphoetae]